MKTKLPSVLQSAEKQSASRHISLTRVALIAIVFSAAGFLLSWHYNNPSIFWVTFGATNLIITIFLIGGFFVLKHQEQLRFYLPTILWIYGLMQVLLILWEVFLRKH